MYISHVSQRLIYEKAYCVEKYEKMMDGPGLGYSYHLPSAGWNLKIRNVLSQFSDLFSEFNKYIAPAYHHDRCERYVKQNSI